jgi:hypothetical protein
MINRVKDFIEFLNEAKGEKKPKKSDVILDALLNTPEGIGYSKLVLRDADKASVENSVSRGEYRITLTKTSPPTIMEVIPDDDGDPTGDYYSFFRSAGRTYGENVSRDLKRLFQHLWERHIRINIDSPLLAGYTKEDRLKMVLDSGIKVSDGLTLKEIANIVNDKIQGSSDLPSVNIEGMYSELPELKQFLDKTGISLGEFKNSENGFTSDIDLDEMSKKNSDFVFYAVSNLIGTNVENLKKYIKIFLKRTGPSYNLVMDKIRIIPSEENRGKNLNSGKYNTIYTIDADNNKSAAKKIYNFFTKNYLNPEKNKFSLAYFNDSPLNSSSNAEKNIIIRSGVNFLVERLCNYLRDVYFDAISNKDLSMIDKGLEHNTKNLAEAFKYIFNDVYRTRSYASTDGKAEALILLNSLDKDKFEKIRSEVLNSGPGGLQAIQYLDSARDNEIKYLEDLLSMDSDSFVENLPKEDYDKAIDLITRSMINLMDIEGDIEPADIRRMIRGKRIFI